MNMNKVALGILIIALFVVAYLFFLWLVTLFWAWVVPDIFAGMVKSGALPAAITGWQAFKFSILLWILGLTTQARGKSN